TFTPYGVTEAGNGDRGERAEDPRQLGADQDRDQDDERGELHRTAVDNGLKDVVLELLVQQKEDDDDHAPDPAELDEDDRGDDHGGHGGSGKRDEVEDCNDDRKRDGVRASDGKERDHRGNPGDDTDQDVAGHVAADCAVDLVADPLPARAGALRQQGVAL